MLIVILFLFAAPARIPAQQPPIPISPISPPETSPATYYRLDFAIREMNGEKLVDTRNYSLWVQSGIRQNVVAGSEVPYPSGSGTTKSISYRSVGVSIFCIVKDVADNPKLDLTLEISDAIPPAKDSDAIAFRKVSINSTASLSLGKPTTVSITEDPSSRHRFQVDVTATKLK
jgi:hypothetical protein